MRVHCRRRPGPPPHHKPPIIRYCKPPPRTCERARSTQVQQNVETCKSASSLTVCRNPQPSQEQSSYVMQLPCYQPHSHPRALPCLSCSRLPTTLYQIVPPLPPLPLPCPFIRACRQPHPASPWSQAACPTPCHTLGTPSHGAHLTCHREAQARSSSSLLLAGRKGGEGPG